MSDTSSTDACESQSDEVSDSPLKTTVEGDYLPENSSDILLNLIPLYIRAKLDISCIALLTKPLSLKCNLLLLVCDSQSLSEVSRQGKRSGGVDSKQ